jgi:N-acetylglucosamine kinase-like BadF-type ATPase
VNAAVIAVDGGASKTHLALLARDGELLRLVRGPASSPQNLGLERAVGALDELYHEAGGNGLGADVAQLNVSGVDFPADEDALRQAIEARGWAKRTIVDNDVFAVLRAGTERGWGVAVVCGSGINCVGVDAAGRHARFPALGAITGDWGGGSDVGSEALFVAARSQDGRGPRTTLERAVPSHFGLETPDEVAEAIYRGRIPRERLLELPPLVFAEAERDEVAAGIVERIASEVVAMARVALDRLELSGGEAQVLLGGGLLQSGDGRLSEAVAHGLRQVAPAVSVAVTSSPPIVGAALLGLDAIDAPAGAHERARRELEDAVRTERGGSDG